MQACGLPRHVGFGTVDGVAIFLDLKRDRYFRLDARGGADFERLLAAAPGSATAGESLERLLETGLLVPAGAGAGAIAPATVPLPRESAIDSGPARASPLIALEIGWRLSLIRRRLRQSRLHAMVESLRERRVRSPRESAPAAMIEPARRFLAARRLVPVAPSCLADSLALSDHLAARSLFPRLVFGVKLDPFAAHCWTQSDDIVLNDSVDAVAEFTPVLVV